MDLQYQPIIKAHPCHFGQHVAAKPIGVFCAVLAAQRFIKKPCYYVLRPLLCSGGGVAIIAGPVSYTNLTLPTYHPV